MNGTMEGQNRRTVDLVIHLIGTGQLTLHGLLYLLNDTQSTDQLKKLAEIASENPTTLALASNKLEHDTLKEQLEIATGALNHYLYGGSNYSQIARNALEAISQKAQEVENARP